ncbi:MAG: Endo-1,4-beta-xylanase Z [Calditrichaeota bacterium]|nr:Endo-1,4-beta-xylanase Z [Calditrichota bacterium]
MMNRAIFLFGVLALLVLCAGCAEEIEAPSAPWAGHEGQLVPVRDAFATAMNPDDGDDDDGDDDDGDDEYYYVYLPDGYSESGDPYPVVYMLHGYGGDEDFYPAIFGLTDAADAMIAAGEIDPIVLVFPNGDNAFGGSFYTDSPHEAVGDAATHIMNVIGEIEADPQFNVGTTPELKAITGLSMGGYGALSLAMDNPDTWGYVAVASAPVSFWGTKTLDPGDDTYAGIEELLPTILAQTGFSPDSTWDPANPNPGVMQAFQDSLNPELGPPTSMMFAMAAAFSPVTNPDDPGPTAHAATGVKLPIGLDGEIYMPVWEQWLARDIVTRLISLDPNINDAASLATFELYLTVGLDDDLGLQGAHQVLAGTPPDGEGVLHGVGFPAEENRYYGDPVDIDGDDEIDQYRVPGPFGGIRAGHIELTQAEFRLILAWCSEKFAE